MQNSKVGARVRAFRDQQTISLEDLAAKAGITPEALARIEDGTACTALGPLSKVARSLGCSLGTLLDDEPVQDPLVVRLGDRSPQDGSHACVNPAPGLTFHSLGKGKLDRHMEPFFVELAPLPEGRDQPAPSSHEGEEFIVAVAGKVSLLYGFEETILEPGDSAYYNSVVPHLVSCHGNEPAAIYAVTYIPF